jgi:agarase
MTVLRLSLRVFLYSSLLLVLAPMATAQSGYFHAEKRNGVWWLIDPDGSPTLTMGVQHIAYDSDRIMGHGARPYQEAIAKIYPDADAWASASVARILSWGFNTVGNFADTSLLWTRDVPYTIILDIADNSGGDWGTGGVADVFDSDFVATAREFAGKMCAPRRYDHSLLGYYSDGELRLGPDWRVNDTLLEVYLKREAGSAGRQAITEFLERRYNGDLKKLNAAWGLSVKDFADVTKPGNGDGFQADADAFQEIYATRYYQICRDAIRAVDPNHMYFGAIHRGLPPDPVLRAMNGIDAIAVNIYDADPRPVLEHIYRVTGKPILVSEFVMRSQESSVPNTKGMGPLLPTQQARAQAYAEFVNSVVRLPGAIGYNFYGYMDSPKEGRFDGDNSNYGLVDNRDNPYKDFVQGVTQANRAAVEAHKKAKR